MTIEELRAAIEAKATEQREMHTAAGDAAFTDEQNTRFERLDTEKAELERTLAEKVESEQRAARVADSRAKWGSLKVGKESDAFDVLRNGGFGASPRQLVDANLRAAEGRIEDAANQSHFERTLKRHAGDKTWAMNILGRSRPEYESGWAKLMMGRGHELTNEERAAVAVGTNTQGGFLVPTHLDPTIILTNSGTSNVIRGLSRVVTLTEGNVWHGVTSAGVTASFDAELAEVSDDSPSVGGPSVTLFTARAFAQASIEAFADISALTTDILMMFADARDRLEGAKHAVGTGTAEPWGIFAALDANTNVEIISTTAATIGEVDIHSVYRQTPIRWRGRGTWLANPLYTLAVKRLGTAVSSSYSGDLREPVSERWLGRPVVESDDAPTTQTTTANDNEIVYGDFSNFLIVDKPGSMSVDFIPHLFNTTTNLPDGRRGWFAYWRNGSDSVNDLAFRLLQDKTSA